MQPVVALLRSVNVGGNRMKMDWLRSLAADVGCRDIGTVLATGNLVMAMPHDLEATRLALEQALAANFGGVDVVMRTRDEMREVIARNPWRGDLGAGRREGKSVHTMFLAAAADPRAVAELDLPDTPAECVVDGRQVYVAYDGPSNVSPLTGAWFERRLGTGTMRNDNSVCRIAAAMDLA